MRVLNRCIAAALAGIMIAGCGSVYAYRERVDNRAKGGSARNISTANDIFCYDFSKGETNEITFLPYGDSKISLAETEGPNGSKQSALMIDDKVPGQDYSGPAFSRSFDGVSSGKIGFDMKFKFEEAGEKDFAGLQIAFNQGGTMILRIYVDGNTGQLGYVPGGGMNSKMVPGKWYRIRMIYDVDSSKAEILYESDQLRTGYVTYSNLDPLAGGSGYKIDNIVISSRFYTGQWYFDYLRMDAGKDIDLGFVRPPFKHPDTLIEPPISDTPQMRAVPKTINVNVNGEYMYYAVKPSFDGEDLMVTAESAFRSFSMIPIVGSGGMSAALGDAQITLTAGSAGVSIGNEKKTLSKAVTDQNGQNMVSLNALAAVLGYTAEWNAGENTLYITGGVQ